MKAVVSRMTRKAVRCMKAVEKGSRPTSMKVVCCMTAVWKRSRPVKALVTYLLVEGSRHLLQ